MLASTPEEHWERLARDDPYFAVLTDARYHRSALTDAALEEFFRSGEVHVSRVFETIRSRLDAAFRPDRALDFGCGVGRVTIPLAAVARSVVAVDASDTMLREARRNWVSRGLSNVEGVVGDSTLSTVAGTFDFIHSFIVFQHIPRRAGAALLRRLIARLREDGVGVLHFTYGDRQRRVTRLLKWAQKSIPLAHEAMNLVRGRAFGSPLMQMNCYSLDRVLGILHETACDDCYLQFTRHGAYDGVVVFFQKRRSGAW
jgi:SAM-dependent methyltransferase